MFNRLQIQLCHIPFKCWQHSSEWNRPAPLTSEPKVSIFPTRQLFRLSFYPFPTLSFHYSVSRYVIFFYPPVPVSSSCITNHPKLRDLKQQAFIVISVVLGVTGIQCAVLTWAQIWLQSVDGQGQSHPKGFLLVSDIRGWLLFGALEGTIG